MATYADQLESVQTAIARIEADGQALEHSGRTLTEADLPRLYEREGWLRKMASREARGGGIRLRRAGFL